MFAFARRPAPQSQHRPFGEPGISAEQYERIAARLREQRATCPLAPILGAATRLKSQPSTITN